MGLGTEIFTVPSEDRKRTQAHSTGVITSLEEGIGYEQAHIVRKKKKERNNRIKDNEKITGYPDRSMPHSE
eukprot:scaffold6843_cov120-Cylindrotheca_fusiformis.AAC.1